MRLLHTKRLEFGEFWDSSVPEYAILSHRWGTDEISYLELQYLINEANQNSNLVSPALYFLKPKNKAGNGLAKIRRARRTARKAGFDWIWIDTCNIDKSSSSELTEAINSMFKYYQNSAVCYAFLQDVTKPGKLFEKSGEKLKQFFASIWWTRGFTLQELLAPKKVIFLDDHWQEFGTKQELASLIRDRTTITEHYLEDAENLRTCCVAKKMSWASSRKTSRVEDAAYSLMGLFDVNMPLLYGEGNKAFLRLQEEIIRRSDDQTIFMHEGDDLLAKSVADFRPFEDHVSRGFPAKFYLNYGFLNKAYAVTNKGVEMTVPFIELEGPETESLTGSKAAKSGMKYRVLLLDCHFDGMDRPCLLPVRRYVMTTGQDNKWTKCLPKSSQGVAAMAKAMDLITTRPMAYEWDTFYVD